MRVAPVEAAAPRRPPRTVTTCGRGLLRPLRCPRRRRICPDGCPGGIGFERGRSACPIVLRSAGSCRFLRRARGRGTRATEQGPKPLCTEFGLLQGEPHRKIPADPPLDLLRVSARHIAPMNPCHQGRAVCGTQCSVVHGLLHHASCATWTPHGHVTREAISQGERLRAILSRQARAGCVSVTLA